MVEVHGYAGHQFVQQREWNLKSLRCIADGYENGVGGGDGELGFAQTLRQAACHSLMRVRRSSMEMLSSSARSSAWRMKA